MLPKLLCSLTLLLALLTVPSLAGEVTATGTAKGCVGTVQVAPRVRTLSRRVLRRRGRVRGIFGRAHARRAARVTARANRGRCG